MPRPVCTLECSTAERVLAGAARLADMVCDRKRLRCAGLWISLLAGDQQNTVLS